MDRRITSSLLAGASAAALLFTGCSADRDKLLASTKTEKTVIGTVGHFDVPMEIYRYAALNYRSDYEQGNPDVWLGEAGTALLKELNTSVDETIANLYTTAAMCEDYGIATDDEYVTTMVEYKMDAIYDSYDYDYAAYKNDIAEYNMTDAVYRFLIRNDVLSEALVNEMVKRGELPDPADMDAFRAIAESDEFIRVKQILIPVTNGSTDDESREKAEKIKTKLDSGVDFEKLLWEEGGDVFMFSNDDGYYISHGTLFTEFEDAAFALEIGETSDVVKTPAGYCIIKRYEKEDDYIAENLGDMYTTYRDGLYNIALEAKRATLSVEWNKEAEKFSIFNMKTEK